MILEVTGGLILMAERFRNRTVCYATLSLFAVKCR